VDPEDVQMHYTAMLCYRASANNRTRIGGGAVQPLQTDEASQALTSKPRMLSPENNNERNRFTIMRVSVLKRW